jgi:hypothetical protein
MLTGPHARPSAVFSWSRDWTRTSSRTYTPLWRAVRYSCCSSSSRRHKYQGAPNIVSASTPIRICSTPSSADLSTTSRQGTPLIPPPASASEDVKEKEEGGGVTSMPSSSIATSDAFGFRLMPYAPSRMSGLRSSTVTLWWGASAPAAARPAMPPPQMIMLSRVLVAVGMLVGCYGLRRVDGEGGMRLLERARGAFISSFCQIGRGVTASDSMRLDLTYCTVPYS